MNWNKITIKFSGSCVVCNKIIKKGDIGLWSKDIGIKHEKCMYINKISCTICGDLVVCAQCEFNAYCDNTSITLCICKKCNIINDQFSAYRNSLRNIKI